MGITNIRGPEDILGRTYGFNGDRRSDHRSTIFCHQCQIPEIGRTLILDVSFSSEADLTTYTPILRLGLNDQWIARGKEAVVAAPASFTTPKTQVCPYFHRLLSIEHPELSVFIIVQGREGAILSKMVLKEDINHLGNQMFFEACNGFCVVFSGVVRKEDTKKLGDPALSFKKAENLSELLDQQPQNDDENTSGRDRIAVLC